MGALRCTLDNSSTLRRPHWCNSRLTLVLPHCANNRCNQWGWSGWLASSALLPEAPGGGESVSVLRGHKGPGESRNGVGGPKHRPGLQPSAVHIPVDLKVILQRGSSHRILCLFFISVVLTLSVTVSKRLHVHPLFLVLYIVRAFSFFVFFRRHRKKMQRQLLSW